MKDFEKFSAEDYACKFYTARIKPKDLMTINVSTILNSEDAYSFNLIVHSLISAAKNISTQPACRLIWLKIMDM